MDESLDATGRVRYCTRCGAAMQDDRCPRCGAIVPADAVTPVPAPAVPAEPPGTWTAAGFHRATRRRRWPRRLVAGLIVLCLVAGAVFALVDVNASLRRTERTLAGASAQVRRQQAAVRDLAANLKSLQDSLNAQISTADVVGSVRDSVATLFAGPDEGSGFAVQSSAGTSTLLTNYHVVASVYATGGRTVQVTNRGTDYAGTIVKVDKVTDLALVTIPVALTPLRFETSVPSVGEPVIAMGSPFGFEGSVSTGVVSAVRDRWVQFSAPVSPGSSGGPLLDAAGHVIGITQAKISVQGAEGLSFAIPDSKICDSFITCEEVVP